MKISRRVISVGIALALIFAAGFLLRDFLQANVVQPLALVLWLGNRLLSSVDQGIYWTMLILLLIFGAFLRLAPRPENRVVEESVSRNAMLTSMGHWRSLIMMHSGEMDRLNFLKQSMATLLKDVYAAKQPEQVPWETYQGFEQGAFPIPASVRKFLLLDEEKKAPLTLAQRLRRLSQAPARWLRHTTGENRAEYYQSIDEVISFMEKQLETEDDD